MAKYKLVSRMIHIGGRIYKTRGEKQVVFDDSVEPFKSLSVELAESEKAGFVKKVGNKEDEAKEKAAAEKKAAEKAAADKAAAEKERKEAEVKEPVKAADKAK